MYSRGTDRNSSQSTQDNFYRQGKESVVGLLPSLFVVSRREPSASLKVETDYDLLGSRTVKTKPKRWESDPLKLFYKIEGHGEETFVWFVGEKVPGVGFVTNTFTTNKSKMIP